MSARVVVVTGTDTEVGKTVVTAGLGRALTELGVHTIAIKPVESGLSGDHTPDGVLLAESTGQESPQRALTRLQEPLAPPGAAETEGVALDEGMWTREIFEAATVADLVLVEGAGGLLSPLTWQTTILDLAGTWGADAIIVSANRLGVLNQTRLTLSCLRESGVTPVAIILSDTGHEHLARATNAETLRRLEPNVPVIEMPWVDNVASAAKALSPIAHELCP